MLKYTLIIDNTMVSVDITNLCIVVHRRGAETGQCEKATGNIRDGLMTSKSNLYGGRAAACVHIMKT